MSKIIDPKLNNPAVIVLQWLTYAFWGLTVFATSILAASVIAYIIAPTNNNEFSAYATAAVLVLLPISVVCDVFYSKREPTHKTGIASVIMIIHAVVFALSGIGALIAIVFSLVQLMISSSDIPGTQIALYSEIVVVVLFALLFLRTLLPARIVKLRRLFPLVIAIIVGVICVLSFIGPIANAQLTRNDRLIDNNIGNIPSAIDTYINAQNKLPASLNAVSLSGDAKKLVDDNLVRYVPNSKPAVVNPVSTDVIAPTTSTMTYYYELCVNYKAASSLNNSGGTVMPAQVDGSGSSTTSSVYPSYPDVYNHPAGDYCYKLSSYSGFIAK